MADERKKIKLLRQLLLEYLIIEPQRMNEDKATGE